MTAFMPDNLSAGLLLPVSLDLGDAIEAVEGRLLDVTPQGRAHIELTVPAPSELTPGIGVAIRPDGKRNLKLVGVVVEISNTRVEVEVNRTGHNEERWSPRERGRLRFRYLKAPEDFDAAGWAHDRPVSMPNGAWVEPDPRVELSLSGLGFLVKEHLSGHLLIECAHPATGDSFRISAKVVRQIPTRHNGIFKVGVQFESVSQASGAALADILTALQDAAIEGFSESATLDLPDMDA